MIAANIQRVLNSVVSRSKCLGFLRCSLTEAVLQTGLEEVRYTKVLACALCMNKLTEAPPRPLFLEPLSLNSPIIIVEI